MRRTRGRLRIVLVHAFDPPPMGTFKQLSRTCGVRTDGSLACWNVGNWIGVTPNGIFTQVALSSGPLLNHGACALELTGEVVCWGGFDNPFPADATFRAIATGVNVPCGIRSNGSLECWPDPFDSGSETRPVEGTFVQVSTGGDYARPVSCAVDVVGEIACWGSIQFGQGSVPAGPFQQVAVGTYHVCGLSTDGSVECWGLGQLDLEVPNGPFVQVTAGGQRACAVEADGDPKCWRYVEGSGNSIDLMPAYAPSGPFTRLAITLLDLQQNVLVCGLRPTGSIACWLRTDGKIACWGATGDSFYSPPEGEFVQIATGFAYCGLIADGDVLHKVGTPCTASCTKVPCGKPIHPDADAPAASGALLILRSAVGLASCHVQVCDVNDSSSVSSVDALGVLRKSVGLPVELNYPV